MSRTIRIKADINSVGVNGPEQVIDLRMRIVNGPQAMLTKHVSVDLTDAEALWVAQRLLIYVAFKNSKLDYRSKEKMDASLIGSINALVDAAKAASAEPVG
jgi:hypothetical protein